MTKGRREGKGRRGPGSVFLCGLIVVYLIYVFYVVSSIYQKARTKLSVLLLRSEIVAKSSQPPQNLCRPLKTFACVSLRYRRRRGGGGGWMAILVVVCGKHLPVFLLVTENVVGGGGGWMAILVVVCAKICGKMCGKMCGKK